MSQSIKRRAFLKQMAAAGVAGPFILPRLSMAESANGKLQHAAIGVAGQGTSDLGNINSHGKVQVVALCDIDAQKLEAASKLYPEARLYRDWRAMLAEEDGNIDSVNVSTPDHTHAPAAMEAIQRGKHVFCEKPLTHEIYEARRLTEAARKKGVATQMGIQIHSHPAYRMAAHWLSEGAIGKVKEWHSWSGAVYTTESKQRPEGRDAVPPHVDWGLWLGVAPERPYKEDTYHPFKWRAWRDFGGGATGDFGCHIFDPVFTGLGITTPLSVTCEAESYSDEVWPGWVVSEYVFAGTPLTADDTIRATWMDGGKKPEVAWSPHLPSDYKLPGSGSMLIGESGTMIIPHYAMPTLYPEADFADYPAPELDELNHYHDFVEAAMGNRIAGANFDFSGPMTEAVLLTNIANRFPKTTLEWNRRRMRFTNHREANKYLKREYRDGWDVKGL